MPMPTNFTVVSHPGPASSPHWCYPGTENGWVGGQLVRSMADNPDSMTWMPQRGCAATIGLPEMTPLSRAHWLRRTALTGVVMGAAIAASPAPALADADAKIDRLLDLLVQKKILSSRQANELLGQTVAGPAVVGRHGRQAAEPPETPPSRQGEIRVTYVPQFVRKQIAARCARR